ncbi:hypothetical protein F3I16_03790 [Pseudomonas sp. L-22-4S-12]|uniref:hypothetical protein n=1 Tax=Pseudomonas sp. L-22-4S-12 TaxID=2610893 RepID=UPI001327BFF0|nr:hypothetical protein [Pseudomonas sp. L-22-4S-12]MWV15160.1 hypothetical protein [Pseudomonas sp. L-22-4S-12]
MGQRVRQAAEKRRARIIAEIAQALTRNNSPECKRPKMVRHDKNEHQKEALVRVEKLAQAAERLIFRRGAHSRALAH